MLAYHRENEADITVAVREYDLQVPYGVIECNGSQVQKISEKPHFKCLVNAGIYLLEPSVYQFIPNGKPLDMTELIKCLIEGERSVVSFPIVEYWIDIGGHDDYEKAQEDVRNGGFQS